MNGGKTIRLVVIDDHGIMRDALRILLEKEGMELAGEAEEALEGVELAKRIRPDIVILDIGMHGIGGIQAAHRLHKELPASKVLILGQYEDEEYVVEALGEADAAGYVIKSEGGPELLGAIRAVAAGKRYISPAIAPIVLEKLRRTKRQPDSNGDLTKREREVLRLIAEGTATKAIANKLGISPKTVQVHRANLAAKLRLPSTAAIVRYAIKHKLMKLD